jgi:hypothetical protein
MAQMIEDIRNEGNVWFAKMEEITAHIQKCIDDGTWSPRTDQLPYYDGPIPELKDAGLA